MAEIRYKLTKIQNGAFYSAWVALSCGHRVEGSALEFTEEEALKKCEQSITKAINAHVKSCSK
jgi:hypothetical protein